MNEVNYVDALVRCENCVHKRQAVNQSVGVVGCAYVDVDCVPPAYSGERLYQGYFRTASGLLYGVLVDPEGKCDGFYTNT